MRFSILTPTFNQQSYLAECIESVFAQTYKEPFQLVIVNDCSNDGIHFTNGGKTITDVEGIKEPSMSKTKGYLTGGLPFAKHIKTTVIHNEYNLGVAKAFNVGMYYCVGDWVAILDHDDKLLPECLTEVSKFIDANDTGNLGIVWTDLITDKGDERHYPNFIPGRLMSCYEMGNLTVYKRKALADANGWRVGLDYSHDTACIIDIVEHGWEIKHIDKVLLWNRLHSEQFTQQYLKAGGDSEGAKRAIAERTLTLRPELWIEARELLALNKATPQWKVETLKLKPYCKGVGVDIGCGRRKRYPYAIGVDLSRGLGNVPEIVCDVEKEELPFMDGSLDYCIFSHVIEHFENPLGTLQNVLKKIKSGGYLLLILPDMNYIPKMGEKNSDPKHRWDFTPEEFNKNIVPKIGGELVSYNSLRNNWSFEAFFRKH